MQDQELGITLACRKLLISGSKHLYGATEERNIQIQSSNSQPMGGRDSSESTNQRPKPGGESDD